MDGSIFEKLVLFLNLFWMLTCYYTHVKHQLHAAPAMYVEQNFNAAHSDILRLHLLLVCIPASVLT